MLVNSFQCELNRNYNIHVLDKDLNQNYKLVIMVHKYYHRPISFSKREMVKLVILDNMLSRSICLASVFFVSGRFTIMFACSVIQNIAVVVLNQDVYSTKMMVAL